MILPRLPFFSPFLLGVYYEPECSSEDLDHGVLVVGYGVQGIEEEDSKKYWIVKNRYLDCNNILRFIFHAFLFPVFLHPLYAGKILLARGQ